MPSLCQLETEPRAVHRVRGRVSYISQLNTTLLNISISKGRAIILFLFTYFLIEDFKKIPLLVYNFFI